MGALRCMGGLVPRNNVMRAPVQRHHATTPPSFLGIPAHAREIRRERRDCLGLAQAGVCVWVRDSLRRLYACDFVSVCGCDIAQAVIHTPRPSFSLSLLPPCPVLFGCVLSSQRITTCGA
jgi:hypothetical protein